MTAILDGGRSFPFVENLITQTDNAKEYQGVSKKLTICNHSNPPFRGKGFPRKGGLTACLLCSAPFRPQPLSLGLSIIRDALRFVKFCRSPALDQRGGKVYYMAAFIRRDLFRCYMRLCCCYMPLPQISRHRR